MWKIIAEALLGEYVDPDPDPAPCPAQSDPGASGWVMSSIHRKHGTEISDELDMVPDDLFDPLFPAPKPRDPN